MSAIYVRGMRTLTALRSRVTLERLLAPFDEPDVDDLLLCHMVRAVYGPRSTLLTATVMGIAFPFICWMMTGGRAFIAIALLEVGVGIVRFDFYERFQKRPAAQLSRRAVLGFDGAFTFWATACMLGVGFTCFELCRWTHVPAMLSVAFAAAVGFPFAAASRNAARKTVQVAQSLAVVVPVFLALSAYYPTRGGYYSAMLLGVFVTAVAIGRSNCARVVELYKMNEANARLARSDSLTGALNRYAFDAELAAALAAIKAFPGKRFAVMTADLDRFKQINDTAGHSVGDAVIAATASRLKSAAPAGAMVARLGGDEFAAIFACTCVEEAGRIAAKMLEAIGKPLEIDGQSVAIGASAGVAVAPDHGSDAHALMRRSDVALYAAKNGGRGRWMVYDGRLTAAKGEPEIAVSARSA